MKGKILTLGYSLLALSLIACAPTMNTSNKDQALIRAAERGQTKEVYRLIEAGADVNARNDKGVTPLHRAIDHPEVAALLIEKGASEIGRAHV